MKNKSYLRWGLTITLSACAILVFYNTFFQNGVLLLFIKKLLHILKPVIYGFALAYLLAPVVNFFDRIFERADKKDRHPTLVRAGSILATWLLVGLFVYGLMHILIPQLVISLQTLAANVEGYYNTVYAWVLRMMDDYPDVSNWLIGRANAYYNELAKLLKSVIPQAQQAFMVVTGGILSILVFFKDLLVGIIVSVYLLATKELFARHSRKFLYCLTNETQYFAALRGAATVNKIFSGFVRGKLLDSLIIGILCFLGATLLDLPYAPLISVIVGVTNVIPFFGPFLGAIPSAFLILLADPLKCLYFVLFVLVLQQFDGNILGPKILGDSTGLSSFWVIVAILVGGGFGGVLGMFLGVPVFACIYAFVTFLVKRRMNALDPDEALFAPGVAAPLPVKSPVVKDRERAKARREAEERAEQDEHSDAQ